MITYNELKLAKDEQETVHHELQDVSQAKILALEKQTYELQEGTLKKAHRIGVKGHGIGVTGHGVTERKASTSEALRKKGLPEPPDDYYFRDAFHTLVEDTRQWARMFTNACHYSPLRHLDSLRLSDELRFHLRESFFDLKGLLNSTSAGPKVRMRCVEALLLRTFTGSYLTVSTMGLFGESTITRATKHPLRQLQWSQRARPPYRLPEAWPAGQGPCCARNSLDRSMWWSGPASRPRRLVQASLGHAGRYRKVGDNPPTSIVLK
ncbi:hypothetical protein EV426DRAFT_577380 [Tirmania nivea]|nr:hypothetical protein EV426DRAFT_577380 [Tirmania nivea]